VLGVLGNGGMGRVYLARATDGRLAAVKVIRPDLAEDPAFLRMFRREATMACRVPQFCTAEVFGFDLDGDTPYLATEYVDGPTLHRAVRERGPLAGPALHRLGVAVATALTAIHGAGLVHRDLKPKNIILGPEGPLVIDFGIAHALDGVSHLSRPTAGTPGYMAPEQIRGTDVGQPTDLFAWGAVMVFAATGESPYGEGPADSVHYRTLHGQPNLVGVPTPLYGLVAVAMDPVPGCRPTAAHLLGELTGGTPPETPPNHAVAAGPPFDPGSFGPGRPVGSRHRRVMTPPSTPRVPAPPGLQPPGQAGTGQPRHVGRRLPGSARAAAAATAAVVAATVLTVVLTRHNGTDGTAQPPVATTTSATTATGTPVVTTTAAVTTTATVAARTLFAQDLTHPESGWPTESTADAQVGFQDQAYVIHALSETFTIVTMPAPTSANKADVTVSATASLAGQGYWGVTCRGSAEGSSESYHFLLTHASAIAITGPGDTGIDWHHVDGIDPTTPNTITARCADVANSGLVLTMTLNGIEVLSRQPGILLGPGYSGFIVGPFNDVEGPRADAHVTSVSITTPR
jgi:predicted Ser/Thr protein kinase